MKGRMTCREGVRRLMDYTEGILSAPHRHAMEDHVRGCVRCQGFVRSYGETPRLLREATRARLPAVVGDRLRRSLRKDRR